MVVPDSIAQLSQMKLLGIARIGPSPANWRATSISAAQYRPS